MQKRSSHNNIAIKETLCKCGLRPSRLLRFLEQHIEAEQAVLTINKQFIEEEEYDERLSTLAEMQIMCIILSET